MLETTFITWLLRWANATAPFIANLILHSSIIIVIGLLAKHTFRKKGAAIQSLMRLGAVRAAYVFGSYVEGRADRWSDIDIAVFMEGVETWDIRRRARAMARVQKEAGLDVEAHLLPATTLDSPQPGSFAEYVLKHGICIT